jgi:putative ABC transport system permease protein
VALIARPVAADGSDLPLVERARAAGSAAAHLDLRGAAGSPGLAAGPAGGRAPGRSPRVGGGGRRVARLRTPDRCSDDGPGRLPATHRGQTGERWGGASGPGARADDVADALASLADPRALEIARPGEIRAISLRIFDRSFAVTYLLEAVAVVIGLAGVAASFAALAAARRREFGMLRHLGLTRRQIGTMLAREGALAAGVGVLGGMLVGGAIGLVLIEVVNRQSFHWSMDLHVPWLSLLLFGTGLVALAAVAAVLAGRQAMGQSAVLAVREDW